MTRYTVMYERDEDGWWVARVPAIPGCHTQGRTLAQARRRIREALSLWVDDADTAQLSDDIRLPAEARHALTRYYAARRRAEDERAKAQESAARTARTLTRDLHLSMRDTGELLGLSHQRIHQLVADGEPAGDAAAAS